MITDVLIRFPKSVLVYEPINYPTRCFYLDTTCKKEARKTKTYIERLDTDLLERRRVNGS